MAVSTRGLVFRGAGRPLEIESLVLDEPQGGEVLVRMVASGVCHSDLHVVDGEWDRPANVVLGHEGAAVVEALGPDVPRDALREGDLVVLAWTAPCGSCPACLGRRAGRSHRSILTPILQPAPELASLRGSASAIGSGRAGGSWRADAHLCELRIGHGRAQVQAHLHRLRLFPVLLGLLLSRS
jgi:threonine dehydrogenase-like Zn-dependent dehydrogenase